MASPVTTCEDTGGPGFCDYVLVQVNRYCSRLSPESRAHCQKTCQDCKQEQNQPVVSNEIPNFARPPEQNQPPSFNNNNPRHPGDATEGNGNASTQIPLWGVILIVVFLLALFVTIGALYFRYSRKRKKKKIEKNRYLLQQTRPSYHPSMQIGSAWDDSWVNAGYDSNEDGRFTLPGNNAANWTQNNLNNVNAKMRTESNNISTKNINLLRNESGTLKRKAPPPPPPEEKIYENFPIRNEEKKAHTTRRAPPPPPPPESVDDHTTLISSSTTTVHNLPAIMDIRHQRNAVRDSMPMPPPAVDQPRVPKSPRTESIATTFATESETTVNDNVTEKNQSIVSQSEVTSFLSPPVEAQNAADPDAGLEGILEEWKKHLFAQKNELEDYYHKLTGYVESVAIQPTDSISNVGLREDYLLPANEPLYHSVQHDRNKSQRRRKPSFPAPPESIMDDWICDPYDVDSQRKVVKDLKRKLTELENLLQNTRELADDSDEDFTAEESEFLPEIPQPQPMPKSRTLPPNNIRNQTNKIRNSRTLIPKKYQRITMQHLLEKLSRTEAERRLNKISRMIESCRSHKGMVMGDKMEQESPSSRLARQIHHVMRDVIRPKLHTNIMLAAQAATNLTSKLAKSIYLEQKQQPQKSHQSLNIICERITALVKQFQDMCKQLEFRFQAYRREDFASFIDTFLQTAMKIMETTYRFVRHENEARRATAPKDMKSSTLDSRDIKAALNDEEVSKLNDGLIQLEKLLKSGNIPGFESSKPSTDKSARPSNTYGAFSDVESVTSCDCDAMSYTSCSTCMPRNMENKQRRNPYLFPGGEAKSLPVSKMPSHDSQLTGYERPPTRPVTNRRDSQKRYQDRYPRDEVTYMDPKDLRHPMRNDVINDEEHDRMVMAKYLHDMVKSQNRRDLTNLPKTMPGYSSKGVIDKPQKNGTPNDLKKSQAKDLGPTGKERKKRDRKQKSDKKVKTKPRQKRNNEKDIQKDKIPGKPTEDLPELKDRVNEPNDTFDEPHQKYEKRKDQPKKSEPTLDKPRALQNETKDKPDNKYNEPEDVPDELTDASDQPEVKADDKQDKPDEPKDGPDKPDNKLDEPEKSEKPDAPVGTPDELENKPDEPTDTPDKPEDKPDEPTDTPDEPEDKPDEPEDNKSDEPDEKPDQLANSPGEPENESDKPTDTQNEPENKPDKPEEKLNEPGNSPDELEDEDGEPEGKPDEPTDTPEEPEEKPDEPEGESDEPTDIPNEPENKPDKPDEPGNSPDKPTNTPDEPEDRSAKPEDTRAEPRDTPEEPEEKPDEPTDTSDEPEDKPLEPEDTPNEPEEKLDEPENESSEPEDTPGEPEEKPDEPGDTPGELEEKPDEPKDKPDEPGDTPEEPGDTPEEQEDKPDEPEDKPDESEDESNEPEDTPGELEEKPDEPKDKPDEPGDTPEEPGDIPGEPGDTPEEPEEKPDEPEDKPDEPTDAPDESEEKPDEPGDTSEEPGDTPEEPEEKPDEPQDKPDEPEDKPDEPEEKPDEPGDTPEEPGDTPEEPEDKPDEPEDKPDEPEDKRDEPGDTPEEPGDTPKEPEEKPDEPEEKPDVPEDKPDEPEDKPDEPEDKPDESEDKPDEPEDKPDEPGDTPEEPEEKPDEPEDRPDEPEDKPGEPGDPPEEPEEKPDEPEEKPDVPEDKPDEPGDTPEEPEEKPDEPEEKPDVPEDKPDEPEDKPDELEDKPDEPGDTPEEPGDTPEEPGDTPEEPEEKPDEPEDRPDEPEDKPGEPGDPPEEPEEKPDEPGDTPEEPEDGSDEPENKLTEPDVPKGKPNKP